MRGYGTIVAIVLFALWCPADQAVLAETLQGEPPSDFFAIEANPDQTPCLSAGEYDFLQREAPSPQSLVTGSLFEPIDSIYAWPLRNALHDRVILVNYVDEDPGFQSIQDYMGYAHSYDGHTGTDITLLNFRMMDQGMPVLAADDGRVLVVGDGYPDRNIVASNVPANFVFVEHAGGHRALYLHLRRYSIVVRPGDLVRRGQMLGYVGSSGSSTDAHLHFEARLGNDLILEPWSGVHHPFPSLWNRQEPYVGTAPLRIYDMGFTTFDAQGGTKPTARLLKEGLIQPAIFGANEHQLSVWLQFQGQAGDHYKLEIQRPDHSLYSAVSTGLAGKFRYGWHFWNWNPIESWTPGLWTVTVTTGTGATNSLQFQVGSETVFAPLFRPAGRSFVLGAQPIQDELHATSSGPVTYSLRRAPTFVSLENATVTISPPSTHRRRSHVFQALATDGAGRQDTMFYHLVDFQARNRFEVPARVFLRDGHRSIANASSKSDLCLQIEPVDHSYSNSGVNPFAIFLTSWDTGLKSEAAAIPVKGLQEADTDRNGVDEITACFSKGDLAQLFSHIRGRTPIDVDVEGDLLNGERFRGTITLDIVGTGQPIAMSVAPNPLNPAGILSFHTRSAGRARVTVFDVRGRLIRTLMDSPMLPEGPHQLRIEGRGDRDEPLASGVYFFRVETPDGATSGKFVVMK